MAALAAMAVLAVGATGLPAAYADQPHSAQQPSAGSFCPASGSASTLGSFNGSRTTELGPVDLNAGLVVLCAQSNGTQNFVVSLVMPDPGQDAANSYGNRYLMIDAIGRYNGGSAALIQQPGRYYLVVSQASGPYTLSVSQPLPETVTPQTATSFHGHGQQVTAPFTLPAGSYTVSIQGDNTGLRVWLYQLDDLGGSALTTELVPQYDGRLIDTTMPPGYTSVPITVDAAGYRPDGTPIDGTYLLYVDAEGIGSGNWTVTVH
jgi:hypothetical protein